MNRLLTLEFYFTPLPDPNFQYTKITIIIALVLILAGFALSYYRKKKIKKVLLKKMLRRYPGQLKTFALLILILLLVRESGIPYLSMRIWWFALLLSFLYLFIKFLISFKKKYRKRLNQASKREIAKKYIPKRKK